LVVRLVGWFGSVYRWLLRLFVCLLLVGHAVGLVAFPGWFVCLRCYVVVTLVVVPTLVGYVYGWFTGLLPHVGLFTVGLLVARLRLLLPHTRLFVVTVTFTPVTFTRCGLHGL